MKKQPKVQHPPEPDPRIENLEAQARQRDRLIADLNKENQRLRQEIESLKKNR